MGRLHNPGVGEKLDRITILELKEEHAAKHGGEEFIPFRDERQALEATLPVFDGTQLDRIAALRNINHQLWEAEDWMRTKRPTFHQMSQTEVYDVARAAFRITELNDNRAALIRELNVDAGDDWTEKL